MAQRNFITHPIVLRRLQVARITDVNPRMRRITLVGEQLAAFEREGLSLPAFSSTGFDDHVKLVFASDGDIAAALPVQLAQTIDWPNAANREMRDYTPRRFDPLTGELDLDFVRHGVGPAASWAEGARVGDKLHIAGPKSSLLMPAELDWVLLAGDETALPAIARYLDERPSTAPVHIVVESGHADARQELALGPHDTIRWVDAVASGPEALFAAVQELDWPSGDVYVWAAAESSALLPLRRWISRERRVPKTHVNVTGYWHSGAGESAVAEPSSVGAITASAPQSVDALLSPVPWFAARAASSIGLLDAVADEPRSVAALSAVLGVEPGATRALVDYLVSIDVFVRSAEHEAIGLGPIGEELMGDDHRREAIDDGLEGRAIEALGALAPALLGHASAFALTHARTLLDELNSDADRFEEYLGEVAGFDFVVRGALGLESVLAASSIAVGGMGCLAFADVAAPGRAITIVEADVPLAVLRGAARTASLTFSNSWSTVDLVVSAHALAYRNDAEAGEYLRALTAASTSAIVIEEVEGEGLGPPNIAEHRLIEFAATGSPRRTAGDVEALVALAGWTVRGRTTLGWNYEAYELTR